MISIFLNLLRFDLWPNMLAIVDNVPCTLEKSLYFPFFFFDEIFCIYLLSSADLLFYFRPLLTFLFFCLDDLSIDVKEVLKSPTIIISLSISPFVADHNFFIYLEAPLLSAYMSVSLLVLIPLSLFKALLSFLWGFPGGTDGKESACNSGDTGLIPGLGRSPGEGNGNPLQYSCLGNSMERGA